MTTDSRRTGRKCGNNEGTIVQRPSDRWTAALTVPDGKRKWFYRKTREAVADQLAAAQRDVQQGLPLPNGRQALGQALKWGLVARNAATLVDPPKLSRKPIAVLTAEESRALMESMRGDVLEPLITLTLATALRRGEALGLRWSDVNLDAHTVAVHGQYQRIEGTWTWVEPKTEASVRTLASLRAHRARQLEQRLAAGPAWEDHDLVFPSALGAPHDGESMSHMVKKRVKRAGLPPISFHGLRHSAATLMLAQGLSIAEIQRVLGHSQISLTANLYTHAAPEIMARAATAMDDLFGVG